MNPMHQVLDEVLHKIRPSQVPEAQKIALNGFKQEVSVFLQKHYAIRDERVGEPFAGGSQVKGTDVAFDYDLDLFIPFRHGFRDKPQKLKADVLNALRDHFKPPQVTIRDQRVSVGVLKGPLTIDVVPGMEQKARPYQHTSANEDDKFLILYDRESNKERITNIARQTRLIKEMTQYRDVVRLLKAWRHREKHIIGSYALELLVYRAATMKDAPKSGSPDVLLRHVLKQAIPFLENDGTLRDIGANYDWPDYLKAPTKVHLAGLWKKVLAALDGADASRLRAFFM